MRKKIKKLFAVAMSTLLAVSVSGCTQKTPQQIYEAAIEKNQSLKDQDISMQMSMGMDLGEESGSVNITMDVDNKITGNQTDDIKYLMEGKMEMLGMEIPITAFYTDGYYYTETLGQKIKYAMDLEDIAKQASSIEKLPQSEYLSEITAEKDGTDTHLTFTMDGERLSDFVKELLKDSALSGLMNGVEETPFEIQGVSGDMTVGKDGYYHDMNMTIQMQMQVDEGSTVQMVIDLACQVNNPGQAVEITLPDTADYQDMSAATTE